MMTRAASERLSYQIDRHRMTDVHFDSGLCCAGPFMSAAARMPRLQIYTRHTTVSACKATAEVWMLLKERDEARFWRGRKRRLGMEAALKAACGLLPSALGVSRRSVL